MATEQETFDRVVIHLASMDHQSGTPHECYYRAPDGNRCAIGCLIEDHEYTDTIEHLGVVRFTTAHNASKDYPTLIHFREEYGWSEQMSSLMNRLQRVHDKTEWIPGDSLRIDMKNMLRKVADTFKLDPAIIDQVAWVPVRSA